MLKPNSLLFKKITLVYVAKETEVQQYYLTFPLYKVYLINTMSDCQIVIFYLQNFRDFPHVNVRRVSHTPSFITKLQP